MPQFPNILLKYLPGNQSPFGQVFPARPNPPGLAKDARTIALEMLKTYITNLTFYRPGATGGPSIPFAIEPKNFHIEWPDYEDDLEMPSIVVLGAPVDYEAIGLTSYLEEASRDLYGKGTVLQWMSEYTEKITLELWCSKRHERRSMLAGIETAMCPTEQMYGLRFVMPDYYNELVCFSLMGRELIDDAESAKNRRKARVEIEMRFNIVALVNYAALAPTVHTVTDVDVDTKEPVTGVEVVAE